jgi:N-acylneuraminate cytidylyltransferase
MTTTSPRTVAIIPARGGSKGIPRKNLRVLAGKPLVAHSIDQARQTPAIERVVVSTDDREIGEVAVRYGAEVVWRPAELSGDTASSESALLHALDHLRDRDGYEPELVVFLQPTSPLRRRDDIGRAVQTLLDEGADSLFSARHVEGFLWRLSEEGVVPVNYDPTRRPRRQDLVETYLEENGSIYVFRPWVLRTHGSRLGGKIAVHLMDALDSFQVDALSDLELMETLQGAPRRGRGELDLSPIALLVLDFDGVMTDNRVLVDQDGHEAVWCHRGDGWGLARLKDAGLEVLVLSTEANPVVAARCRKLGIGCVQACDDKLSALRELARERGLERERVAFVGNDVNDLDCLGWVGFPIVVADAHPSAVSMASWVTLSAGGSGAVREVADRLLQCLQPAPRL